MRRHAVHRGVGLLVLLLALALVAGGCNTRPTPEVFDVASTTTTAVGVARVTSVPPTLPPPEERVMGSVISVTDGDTVKMRIDGAPHDVRLLGINAPEMSECWGPDATALLANAIAGKDVVLVSGGEDTDAFGRLLRYLLLETAEGPIFINSMMVAQGNAIGLQNGHAYERTFKALEATAFQSGRGMWGTFVCGDAEGTSADRPVIRVSEIQFDPPGPDDDNLENEWVTITNEGYGRVSLSGWVLRDESSRNRLTFPSGTVLAPGDTVTVITGCAGGTVSAIHWCNDGAVWSNGGDTVIVSDTLGNAVIWYTYTGEN